MADMITASNLITLGQRLCILLNPQVTHVNTLIQEIDGFLGAVTACGLTQTAVAAQPLRTIATIPYRLRSRTVTPMAEAQLKAYMEPIVATLYAEVDEKAHAHGNGVSNSSTGHVVAVDEVDMKIVDALRLLVPSAALSYEQALLDLQTTNRLSWRGPATDLREALRETLDRLAPDEDVTAEPGFRGEPETRGPTMRQKVRHVLRRRSVSPRTSETPEAAVDAVEVTLSTFVRSVYTRSNVSTHTPTERSEVLRVRDFVRVVLCELLEIHAQ